MLNKLTKQERILIISLLTVIVWVAGIMLIIKPAFEDNSEMTDKVEAAEFEKEELDRKLISEPTIKKNIETTKVEMYANIEAFFPATENYDVDQHIMTYLTKSGVKISSVTIVDPIVATLDYYSYTESPLTYPLGDYAKSQRADKAVGGMITTDEAVTDPTGTTDPNTSTAVNEICEKTTVTISLEGSQAQVRTFIDEISKDPKTLLVTNANVNDNNTGKWVGTVTIDFLAVDKNV